MAKIYKISGYIVDANDDFNEDDYDISINKFKAESADIGEWYDEHPLNYINCPIEEYEKYFRE